MPIKINNNDMAICKGSQRIMSVMLGARCVYGKHLADFKIYYPAKLEGFGFFIEVNGKKQIDNPSEAGEFKAYYGDDILLRTYAEATYDNCLSEVKMLGKHIDSQLYDLEANNVSITRASIYRFELLGDVFINIQKGGQIQKVRINILKDVGIEKTEFHYMKGPYDYSGEEDITIGNIGTFVTTEDDYIDLNRYCRLTAQNNGEANIRFFKHDGYKIISSDIIDSVVLNDYTYRQISVKTEKGKEVNLINSTLISDEHVILDICSDYTSNRYKVQHAKLYVGDKISIPNTQAYRIGTKTHRKPGVGVKCDDEIVIPITFTDNISYIVPDVKSLTLELRQGEPRVRCEYNLGLIATFYRVTNLSDMVIRYSSVKNRSITPVDGFGTEDYYISKLMMTYSCKRHLGDVDTDDYLQIKQTDVPENFSYKYDKKPINKTVIEGSYKLDVDGKGITLKVTEYDTTWVANTSAKGNLFVQEILI